MKTESETELKSDSLITTENITKLVVLVKFDSGDIHQVLLNEKERDLTLDLLVNSVLDKKMSVSAKIDSIDF
jgi:hypothetical protein